MMHTVAIHQPNFLPFLGFWSKASMVDTFIILDTTQFVSKQFQNRCQIRTGQGVQWLTVPVKAHRETLIKNVQIANEHPWQAKVMRTINMNYKYSPFFDKYHNTLNWILKDVTWELLADLNVALIEKLSYWLDIQPQFIRASEMKTVGDGQEYLRDLVLEVGGDAYITGSTRKDYHRPEIFEEAGIEVIDQQFVHPEYKQQFNGFEKNCSVLDLLLTNGRTSKSIITGEI